MSPHLPPSLLQLLRPTSSECREKPTSDRHFVTWTDQEDEILRQAVRTHGTDKWSLIAAQFRSKTSRQCRRRWNTYLSTDCKKGGWSPEEDQLLLEAHRKYGNRWTEIAKVVPGRTDNAVKNRFCALGKKRARGEMNTEEGKTLLKRKVLEQNSNIANKRIRGDYIQSCPQRQQHIDIKKSLQNWPTDQSLAHRAHPMRRLPIVQTKNPIPAVPHPTEKCLQDSRAFNCQVASQLAHGVLVDKSTLSQGSGSLQVSSSFSENVSSKLAALTQNAALLDSLVERRNARLKIWGDSEEAWKFFDWFTIEDEGNISQSTQYASQGLQSLDDVKEALYEAKENFIDFSQIPSVSQFASTLPVGQEPTHFQLQHEFGSLTPTLQNERSWNFRQEYEGLDSSSPSNAGSNQAEDSSPTQNDCFSTVPSEQNKECMLEKGEEVQGSKPDQSKDIKSRWLGYSFDDVSSPMNFTTDSQFLIDGMPSPQFSDSEKQFLLSALDSSYGDSALEFPFLENTSIAFYCTS